MMSAGLSAAMLGSLPPVSQAVLGAAVGLELMGLDGKFLRTAMVAAVREAMLKEETLLPWRMLGRPLHLWRRC